MSEDEEHKSPSSELIVQCEDCLAVFLSQNDYETHECACIKAEAEDNKSLIQNHQTPQSLLCPGCKILFENNSEFEDHNCPSQPFKCGTCEKRYTRKESLRRHTRDEHSEEGKSQPK